MNELESKQREVRKGHGLLLRN